jgi:hypothetical protein
MRAGLSWHKFDHLVSGGVNDRNVVRRIRGWAIDVRQRKDGGRHPLSVRINRRLNWPLKRVKDVKIGLAIGCECDWDVLRYRSRVSRVHLMTVTMPLTRLAT